MWGRSLDPKFIATTLAWLDTATPQERSQFKGAVQYPTAISAKPSAHGPSSGRRSASPFLGGAAGLRVPGQRPHSATGTRPPQGDERPSTGIDRGALEAATAFVKSRPRPASAAGSRPPSVASYNRPASAMGGSRGGPFAFKAPLPSRGASRQGGDLAQTLQKATIGATWAAPLADGGRS